MVRCITLQYSICYNPTIELQLVYNIMYVRTNSIPGDMTTTPKTKPATITNPVTIEPKTTASPGNYDYV